MRDVMHLPGVTHLVVLTTSAHPAPWIAGRGLQSETWHFQSMFSVLETYYELFAGPVGLTID